LSYVYVLRSLNEPDHIYIGWTNDLRQRLKEHNWGLSPHTGIVHGISHGTRDFRARQRRTTLSTI
jgi:predicted GIY-YIG superfamily endonuclease